jgi:hypothetical protein
LGNVCIWMTPIDVPDILLQFDLFCVLNVKKKNELNLIIQAHLLMLGQLLTILILLEKEWEKTLVKQFESCLAAFFF